MCQESNLSHVRQRLEHHQQYNLSLLISQQYMLLSKKLEGLAGGMFAVDAGLLVVMQFCRDVSYVGRIKPTTTLKSFLYTPPLHND
jgi:hypothetical protein